METTGLDQQKDEVIELGMVKFDYLPDGRVAGPREVFSSFNEPSVPIPLEATALTGITDEMVAGQRVDEAAVSSFADDAVIVIAHNASFDRKFAERYWPVFQRKAWGCSAAEAEWRKHGFEGSRLGYLLNGAGFFHQAHRAVDDCHALLEILAFELPTAGAPALAVLLEQARKRRCECGPSSRLSNSKTLSDVEATVGATEAMAGRGRHHLRTNPPGERSGHLAR
jgi:DNA polymerase III subunit epsilon